MGPATAYAYTPTSLTSRHSPRDVSAASGVHAFSVAAGLSTEGKPMSKTNSGPSPRVTAICIVNTFDYPLYFFSVRANAAERAQRFLAGHPGLR